MSNLGPNLEAYCLKCGFVPGPKSHSFACPKCEYKGGWGVRKPKPPRR